MKVYSYVLNIVKDQLVAEEITQNTFMKAMTAKCTFKENASEYTYLCAIAKNLCFDYFREEQKKSVLPTDERMATTEDTLTGFLQKETTLAVHKMLHKMEEPYKEVFSLRIFGELSFAEIASIFHKSESWARVTYHRARIKLKERLNTYE